MPTFVLVCEQEAISKQLMSLLSREKQDCQVIKLRPVDQIANRLAQEQPDLLMVVLSPDPEPALNLLQLVRNNVSSKIWAIGPASDSKMRLRAIRAGADQFLDENELEAELEALLPRILFAANGPSTLGRMTAVLPTRGGCGASTVAVNLAVLFAKSHKSCILVDLNLRSGDQAGLLDVNPVHSLADLCANPAQLDRTMLERSLVSHESGLRLLAPPLNFADIPHVKVDRARQALNQARATARHVVLDLEDAYHPEQVHALLLADDVLLISQLEFLSLGNTRRLLNDLERLGVGPERLRLVVNRAGQPGELPAAKIEERLGRKINHFLPEDPKTINRATNRGIPAVIDSPKAKFSLNLGEIMSSLSGPRPDKQDAGGERFGQAKIFGEFGKDRVGHDQRQTRQPGVAEASQTSKALSK